VHLVREADAQEVGDLEGLRPRHPGRPGCSRSSFRSRGRRVKRIRFHDLRHTHTTLLLQANVHPKVVQERLGHSSITVTMGTYSHVTPNMQEEAPPLGSDQPAPAGPAWRKC
jgi:integrase